MTAVFCHNAADRTAATWGKQLTPFRRLEFAVSDAAKGIGSAVAQVAAARRDDPAAKALEHGLDVFHTARQAQCVLARHWRGGEAAWEQAEAADGEVADAKQHGLDEQPVAAESLRTSTLMGEKALQPSPLGIGQGVTVHVDL